MSNVRINNKKNAIVITKDFAKKASLFGTEEYRMLQEVRRDYPTFRIEVSKASRPTDSIKGLSYKYMENYITKKYGKDSEAMNKYLEFRALTDEAREMNAEPVSYKVIKDWFLEDNPEIEAFHARRDKLAEEVKAKRAEKKNQSIA